MNSITVGEVLEKAKTNPKLKNLYDVYIELSKLISSLSLLKENEAFDMIEKEELKKAYNAVLNADNIISKIEIELKKDGGSK